MPTKRRNLAAAAVGAVWFDFPKSDLRLARALCVLLAVLAVGLVAALVLLELLRRFCEGKRHFFYVADLGTEASTLAELARRHPEFLPAVSIHPARRDAHLPMLGEFDGVADEVLEKLHHLSGIHAQGGQRVLALQLDDYVLGAVRAEMLPYGAPEYRDLELYLAWRAQGLPIEAPGEKVLPPLSATEPPMAPAKPVLAA